MGYPSTRCRDNTTRVWGAIFIYIQLILEVIILRQYFKHKGLILIAAIPLAVSSGEIFSQTLDSAVSGLLGNYCEALKDGTSQNTFLPQIGAELQAICRAPIAAGPSAQAASTGGAAGSSQVGNAFVKRIRKFREDENSDEIGGGSGDISKSLSNGLSVFLSSQLEGLNRKNSTFEGGYNSNFWGISAGADYQFSPKILGGVLLNANRWEGDFNGSGNFQTDSIGPTVFASFLPIDNMFIDVSFRYSVKHFQKSRFASFSQVFPSVTHTFSGISGSNFGGDELETGVSMGYDLFLQNITVGPRIAMNYRRLNMNGYTETGSSGLELRYLGDRADSLQTSIGFQASTSVSTGFGVLVPQINADWTHEFELDQRFVSVQFAQDFRPVPTTFSYQTERPDRDFFHLGGGVVAVLPKNLQAYANFETLLGHSYLNDYVGSTGVRFGF